MDEIYNFISNVGFPIAVAGYLLVRIEAKLDKLTLSVEKMADATRSAAEAAATAAATAATLAAQVRG